MHFYNRDSLFALSSAAPSYNLCAKGHQYQLPFTNDQSFSNSFMNRLSVHESHTVCCNIVLFLLDFTVQSCLIRRLPETVICTRL